MVFGAFLLAMQAAGAIISATQYSGQKSLIRQGRAVEQSAFETNLEALRTQNAESSLAALQDLRKNIGSQIATNAARGVLSGAGSAQTAIQSSERNFSKDEQTRRMNLLASENELRANNVLSGIHTLQSETQLGQSLTSQIFNTIPVSSIVSKYFPEKKPGKKDSPFGLEPV